MSDSLSDLLLTDAELDLLARREGTASEDPALAGLACLARAVDEWPLPEILPGAVRRGRPVRKCGWALSMTAGLVLASSGVASAVADDPLAPLHYVRDHVTRLDPTRGAPNAWDFHGSGPVSSTMVSGAGVVRAGHLAERGDGPAAASAPGAGTVLGYGRVRTPTARRVSGSGGAHRRDSSPGPMAGETTDPVLSPDDAAPTDAR